MCYMFQTIKLTCATNLSYFSWYHAVALPADQQLDVPGEPEMSSGNRDGTRTPGVNMGPYYLDLACGEIPPSGVGKIPASEKDEAFKGCLGARSSFVAF